MLRELVRKVKSVEDRVSKINVGLMLEREAKEKCCRDVFSEVREKRSSSVGVEYSQSVS